MNGWALVFILLSLPVYALQRVDEEEAGAAVVRLSAHEPNHLWIDGRSIRRIICKNHVFEYIEDKGHGDVFIKSKIESGSADIFVIDDHDCFYRIHAEIVDKMASEIKIFPKHSGESKIKDDGHVASIRRMMLKLYVLSSNNQSQKSQKINDIMEIQWLAGLDDQQLHGDVYLLKNISKKILNLHEKMFSQYGDKVQAVAIVRRYLPEKASTRILIVRER